jgi:hypothetical protein
LSGDEGDIAGFERFESGVAAMEAARTNNFMALNPRQATARQVLDKWAGGIQLS